MTIDVCTSVLPYDVYWSHFVEALDPIDAMALVCVNKLSVRTYYRGTAYFRLHHWNDVFFALTGNVFNTIVREQRNIEERNVRRAVLKIRAVLRHVTLSVTERDVTHHKTLVKLDDNLMRIVFTSPRGSYFSEKATIALSYDRLPLYSLSIGNVPPFDPYVGEYHTHVWLREDIVRVGFHFYNQNDLKNRYQQIVFIMVRKLNLEIVDDILKLAATSKRLYRPKSLFSE